MAYPSTWEEIELGLGALAAAHPRDVHADRPAVHEPREPPVVVRARRDA